jgi:signal transduction histidine kinase
MPHALIPTLIIGLLNACVIALVFRLGDRSRAGFFLLTNALILIIWAGGRSLYLVMGGQSPGILALPYLASLLVPANYLYHALTRPRPLGRHAGHPAILFLVFLPALAIAALEDYQIAEAGGLLFDSRLAMSDLTLDHRTARAAVLFAATCFAATLAIHGVRYATGSGAETTVSKQLIAAITGPILGAGLFWALGSAGGMIPSPGLVMALVAQCGLIVALRQEDVSRERLFTRAFYYLAAALVAFLLVALLLEFYVVLRGRVVLERTVIWLVAGAMAAIVLALRLLPAERLLDRIFFGRAAEYRALMEEARAELHAARERLRRTERLTLAGELAARVAHEIKNPLGPIRGYTQLMREKLADTPEFRHRERFLQYLEVIGEEIDSIDRRLRQFLDSARAGQLLVEDVDVNRLVERCARLIALESATMRELDPDLAEVTIEVHTTPDLGLIPGDTGRLEEALFNIARNSLEAIGGAPSGTIIFSTRPAPGPDDRPGVEITVEDDGPGFPSPHTDVFFEPFISQKPGGTGLGLSIVRSFIEAHGGTVTLANRSTRGAIATLWLPRESRPNPGALLPKGG